MTTRGTTRDLCHGTACDRTDDLLGEGSVAVAAVLGLALGCAAAALLGSCLGEGWWQALAMIAGGGLGALAADRSGPAAG